MEEREISFQHVLDTLYFERRLVALVVAAFLVLGLAYVILATPVYRADLLIQIEDSGSEGKDALSQLSALYGNKTQAMAEMEIIRSRKVVSHAVDSLHLDIDAHPKYFPVIGKWMAESSDSLSRPGLLGFGGYTWGAEAIEVGKFIVPDDLQGSRFVITADGKGGYTIRSKDGSIDAQGKVGELLTLPVSGGAIELSISRLLGNEGAEFILVHRSHLRAVAGLQSQLNIAERGKSSGVISVQLEGTNRRLIANEINQIGEGYIRQNIERKSAEAENTLAFLNDYLPSLKKSLEEAEDRYIKLRNEKGTVDLTEEVKLTLERSVETRKKLAELNIRRDEMLNRFTPVHPSVQSLDAQIASLRRESAGLNEEIRKLPSLEREVLTVTRDVKINSELYTSLLNTAQQLRLVKAGKVGSVRIVDPAVVPEVPVRPKKMQSLILFVLAGMVFGVIVAFIKKRLFGGIEDPSEIEQHTGLNVLASVPESAKLMLLSERIESRQQGIHLLEKLDPTEPAVESLRSFRIALQFSMLNARNNMILMTGPTPGIGKSVVCSNFAAILASTGKKVLLVDLDLRKGYLNHYFGLSREGGISDFVLGDRTFEQVVHRNVVENLDFAATGTLPPAPNVLLLHDNLRQFLERAAAEYDLVLVDSPPVLAVTDSTVIAPLFGTKILIVRENMTTLGELGETIKRFSQIGETVTGVLFNGIRPRVGYAYGYGKYRYRNYAYGSAVDNE